MFQANSHLIITPLTISEEKKKEKIHRLFCPLPAKNKIALWRLAD
jgi:hypothetical protein